MARVAVLDACVLYPITLTDTLLRSAEEGFLIPQWSERILEEVERNITDKCSPEDAAHRIGQMREAFPEAMVRGWEHLEAAMTNHPKDRHVLAAAVQSQASLIVTSNLADFPEASCAPYGIEAIHPDALLQEFLVEQSETMLVLLTDQAADLQYPPMSLDELLTHLSRHAPEFADAVRMLPQHEGST